MSKKLTYEFVKEVFEKEDYTLLSTEYISGKSKLIYRCPEGHIHTMTWSNFKTGCRCPSCTGNTKLTYKYVKSFFEKNNCVLLSDTYINARTKLKYMCPEGHIQEIVFDSFRRGHRCKKCWDTTRFGKNHHNWKGGITKLKLPLYETFAPKLEKYQSVYKIEYDGLELLGVECKYCNKVFIPKLGDVVNRVSTIFGNVRGEYNLYCTNECKEACPIFRQILWPKNNKPYENTRPDKTRWATMVKERDNHTCQKCEAKNKVMYAHHIDPVINNPIESADIDNGVTLCKTCHKKIHKIEGCTYYELKC